MMKQSQFLTLIFLSAAINLFGQSEVKSIDFYNFTYDARCGKQEPTSTVVKNGVFFEERQVPAAAVSRKKGEQIPRMVWERRYFRPFEIVYGDLNSDGWNEAVALTTCGTGGVESYSEGFIFTTKSGTAELLTRFDGGDRAAGGLRTARVENGILVLERSRPGVSGDSCCPEFIETSRFRLEDGTLISVGEPARVPIYPPTPITFAEGAIAATFDLTIPKRDELKRFSIAGKKGQTLYVSTTSRDARLRLYSGDAELAVNPKPTKKSIAYRATNVLEAKLRNSGEYVFEVGNLSDSNDDLSVTVSVELKK